MTKRVTDNNPTQSRQTLLRRIKTMEKKVLKADKESETRGKELMKLAKIIEINKDQLTDYFKNEVEPVITGFNKRCTKQKP